MGAEQIVPYLPQYNKESDTLPLKSHQILGLARRTISFMKKMTSIVLKAKSNARRQQRQPRQPRRQLHRLLRLQDSTLSGLPLVLDLPVKKNKTAIIQGTK